MSFELIKTLFYFLSGGFLIFLAVTIARDNFNNRLNRVTSAMILFAGLSPVFVAFGLIINSSGSTTPQFQETTIYNLHYIWEFFFPTLLLFSWIFPHDRLKVFQHPRLRYLIFTPQIIHLIVVIFFSGFIDFLDTFKIDPNSESITDIILKPFAVVASWFKIFLSFIYSYHLMIFGFVNFVFIAFSFYFLESGRRYLQKPLLITQTRVVLWALRLSLGLFIIAHLGTTFLPYEVRPELKSALLLLALISGTSLLIYSTIRYQFLDVRIIFRQSFVYSITSGLLVGFYIFLVVKSESFLTPIFNEQSEIISYIFIIFILLLFQPINNWIEEFIRSLFIRTRTDHRNVLERFSRQVISLFDPSKLRKIIEETLKTTLLVERVYMVLYDDSVNEYAVYANDDNPKKIILERNDMMLRGINLLDSPTYYHTLEDFKENSELAEFLENQKIKLILPMKDSEHLLGFIALTNKAAGYTYSNEDLNLLGVLSNQMVTALTNARLYVDSLERIRLQEEVNMARQIQLDLLPSKPPTPKTMLISAHSTPSRTVGGDYYDFIEMDNGKIGICIADASGKGMPAALMIAQTQAILKSEVSNGNPIEKVLRNMNQQLVQSSSSEKYVTLFYGELDTVSGEFQYANAGHNYPVLVRADGSYELLKTGGLIIGALPMMTYEEGTVKLKQNDLLFFFTDGLSEAMNQSGEEYTEERVRNFISKNRKCDPQILIDSILKDVRSYDPTYPPRDDTTMIAIKVNNGFN